MKVVNVGNWSRTVFMDVLLFFNLATIWENTYISFSALSPIRWNIAYSFGLIEQKCKNMFLTR
jgi:hypothetical protein